MNALLLIDIQNDFMPGGALPVSEGDAVVPVVNRLIERSERPARGRSPIIAGRPPVAGRSPMFDVIVATQDWHPPDHRSFAAQHPDRRPGDVIELGGLRQILWPVHCVQGTPGAAFHPKLNVARIQRVFRKGTDRNIDSYSGFFDNGHRKATGLGDCLKDLGVTDIYMAGLATDYCVKCTVLDARDLGFRVYVFADACRGVNLHSGDVEQAVREMERAGATMIETRNSECGMRNEEG